MFCLMLCLFIWHYLILGLMDLSGQLLLLKTALIYCIPEYGQFLCN